MEDRAVQVTRKDVKNIYLKVSREGHVSVTAPRRMTREEIDAFIKSHEGWISKKLAEMEARRGGKPGLQWEPDLYLYTSNGQESPETRRIYRRDTPSTEGASICLEP